MKYPSKTCVIYGPPGTGKTTKIVELLKQEINNGINPCRVAIVSFTRSAAKNIAERVHDLDILDKYVCTLHSMAFKIANISTTQVIGVQEINEFKNEIGVDIDMENREELILGNEYMALYAKAKASGNDFSFEYVTSERPGTLNEFLYFANSYDMYKKMNGYIDYNDMLLEALNCEQIPEIDLLCVDEAQDLSYIQWKLIEKWMPSLKKVIVAGDDDQSIYAWGGAKAEGMHDFEKKYNAERIVLEKSYRVPKTIQNIAEKLIKCVKNRVPKKYESRDAIGEIATHIDDFDSLEIDPTQETFILYRNHSLRAHIENYLIEKNYPYKILSGKKGMFCNTLFKAVTLWDQVSETIDTYEPSKKEQKILVKHFTDEAKELFLSKNLTPLLCQPWQRVFEYTLGEKIYIEEVEKNYTLNFIPKITLSTFHASKGLEAERVIVLNSLGYRTSENYFNDIDNEIRSFYVALTRSKNRLDIVEGQNSLEVINQVCKEVAHV